MLSFSKEKVWVHDVATGRCQSCSLIQSIYLNIRYIVLRRKFGFMTWQLGDAKENEEDVGV